MSAYLYYSMAKGSVLIASVVRRPTRCASSQLRNICACDGGIERIASDDLVRVRGSYHPRVDERI